MITSLIPNFDKSKPRIPPLLHVAWNKANTEVDESGWLHVRTVSSSRFMEQPLGKSCLKATVPDEMLGLGNQENSVAETLLPTCFPVCTHLKTCCEVKNTPIEEQRRADKRESMPAETLIHAKRFLASGVNRRGNSSMQEIVRDTALCKTFVYLKHIIISTYQLHCGICFDRTFAIRHPWADRNVPWGLESVNIELCILIRLTCRSAYFK